MIRWIKRLLFVIFLFMAVGLGVIFTIQNSQSVSLVLLGFPLPELKLGFWIMLVLLLGALLGLLISYIPLLLGSHSVASKDRKIKQLQKEIQSLRLSSLKG